MNTQRFFIGIIFSILLQAFLLSCEEEKVEPTGNPDDKQYIGKWTGTTNEGLLVSFSIDSINHWTRLSRFIINYYRDTINSHSSGHIDGLAKVENGEFYIDMGHGDMLQGKFTGNNFLTGSIIIDNNIRGFSCTNEKGEQNMNSPSQTKFRFREINYSYRQDQDSVVSRLDEHLTYYNRKYFSSSLMLNRQTHDSVRLIKITKGRLTDIWNEAAFLQYFTPGKRNYSIDARNGIEITIWDVEDNFKKWSTSLGNGNQQGSSFEIVEMQKLENDLKGRIIIKLIAEFDCMMYDYEGNSEKLTDGKFIGFFEQELEK